MVVVNFGKYNLPQIIMRKKEIRSKGKYGEAQAKAVVYKAWAPRSCKLATLLLTLSEQPNN